MKILKFPPKKIIKQMVEEGKREIDENVTAVAVRFCLSHSILKAIIIIQIINITIHVKAEEKKK